jgi:hypothetical protein
MSLPECQEVRSFSCDLKDLNLLHGIRRANLDVFWARRPGTVKNIFSLMLRIVKVQEELHGLPGGFFFRPQGPHLLEDTFRMTYTVVILDHSLNAGINATILQFNTIHKNRLAMSNYETTTAPEMWHAELDGYKRGERIHVECVTS